MAAEAPMSAATFRAFSVHRHLPTCNSRGHTRPRPMQHLAAAAKTVIVCTNSGCKKKGGAAALKWFQELAPEEVRAWHCGSAWLLLLLLLLQVMFVLMLMRA